MVSVAPPVVVAQFMLSHMNRAYTHLLIWFNRYKLMLSCWNTNLNDRPPFSEIVVTVSSALEHLAGYLDFTTAMNAAHPTPPQDASNGGPPPVIVMITGPEGDPLEN